MYRTEQEWITAYQNKGALWIHNDNVNRPHALLASGKHSNGFFNSRLVIADEAMLREAASDLVEKYQKMHGIGHYIDAVVGPQTGATLLAKLIAEVRSALPQGNPTFSESPAKKEVDGRTIMHFSQDEIAGLHRRAIILCEDVISTGGSINLVVDALAAVECRIVPVIIALVNRSGKSDIQERNIVALIDRELPMWRPEDCPLCKKGSIVIIPKDNWKRLTSTN